MTGVADVDLSREAPIVVSKLAEKVEYMTEPREDKTRQRRSDSDRSTTNGSRNPKVIAWLLNMG